MFTVYAEKDIFENIVVFNDQAPHWFNILCNYSDVCLNMTDEEFKDVGVKRPTPIHTERLVIIKRLRRLSSV